jgi:uncharacterized protein YecT (DUF1311 family)
MATAASDRTKKSALDDCTNASTQTELNECAHSNALRERQRMDRTLAKVLGERGERERAAVRAAQRAWQVYADAQIEALYPGCAASLACGSVHSMCRAMALAALVQIRITELEGMLGKSHLEGDVCAPQSAYEMP